CAPGSDLAAEEHTSSGSGGMSIVVARRGSTGKETLTNDLTMPSSDVENNRYRRSKENCDDAATDACSAHAQRLHIASRAGDPGESAGRPYPCERGDAALCHLRLRPVVQDLH